MKISYCEEGRSKRVASKDFEEGKIYLNSVGTPIIKLGRQVLYFNNDGFIRIYTWSDLSSTPQYVEAPEGFTIRVKQT